MDFGEAIDSAFCSFPIFQASWPLNMNSLSFFGHNFRAGSKMHHSKFKWLSIVPQIRYNQNILLNHQIPCKAVDLFNDNCLDPLAVLLQIQHHIR